MIILCVLVQVQRQEPIGDSVFPYWPRTVENRAALRTAISALAAVLIAFAFHVPNPFWAGMSVVIVTNLYTGSIIDKAMMRLVGTILGAVLGFYIAGMVANSFFLYLLSCFLVIAVSVYYYYYSKHGYAYLLGSLCIFIIISQVVINPVKAFEVAIWRPVEIGIGVIVFAIGVYAIFPNHLKDNITVQLNDVITHLINEFKELSSCIAKTKPDMQHLLDTNLQIKKKIRKATELIGALNRELGIERFKTDELRAVLDSFFSLSRQIQYLIAVPYTVKDLLFLQSLPIEDVFLAIEHDLSQLQKGLVTEQSSLNLHTDAALVSLEKKLQEVSSSPFLKSDFIFSLIVFLHQVKDNFSFLRSLLLKNPIQKENKDIILTKKDRLRSDVTLVKHSIKAGFSVLLAVGFWLVSNWPGGINGIVSSVVISLRQNLLEMRTIIVHRILGCTLGGGVALASLAIVEMNLYDFIVIMFLAIWCFSYYMFKYPKYAYIGLQANIALIIALAQEGGPPISLDPPLQRLAGVFIGIAASFIVANVLWRSDVWSTLNRYLSKIYNYMTFNLEQILFIKGQKTLHDLSNIFWLTRGLIEALADTKLSVKKKIRLTRLREQFESYVMIQATINYILGSVDRDKARVTALLFGSDLSVYEHQLIALYKSQDKPKAHQLTQDIRVLAEEIKNNPTYLTVDLNNSRNLLAYLNALKQLSHSISLQSKSEQVNQELNEQLI